MLDFYTCKICGNLILKIEDGGTTPACCNQDMVKLEPASTDGAHEKHVPVIEIQSTSVDYKHVLIRVGSDAHPMEGSHYIQWIALETNRGIQLKYLTPGSLPQAEFLLDADEIILAAYEYCNLHGLWIG